MHARCGHVNRKPVDFDEHCVHFSLLLGGGQHARVERSAVLEVAEARALGGGEGMVVGDGCARFWLGFGV